MKKSAYAVAVVGATGLVGGELVTALGERQFPLATLRLYASLNSAGGTVHCGDLAARVEPLDQARFEGLDIVFLAAGERVSAEVTSRAATAGAVVIDCSALAAPDADVPLVVPEVNAAAAGQYGNRRLVVCPDAVTAALAVVLAPLHAVVGFRRVTVCALEPVSGVGRAGIEELQRQSRELLSGQSTDTEVFPHRIAFNMVPQVGEFLAGGSTRDELQTIVSLRRLLGEPTLPVSVTRVRAPVFYGCAVAVNVEMAAPLSAERVRAVLRAAPGVLLEDDVAERQYPTLADTVGHDATSVGRIRCDPTDHVLDGWIVVDNLRKGSAVNAVQIAEVLVRDFL